MSLEGRDNRDPSGDRRDSRPVGTITYPSGNPALPEPSQPRQPRNLQDLLRYSTEVTAAAGRSDGNPANNEPLDEESKKFLEEALKYMTVDVIGELLKSIKTLEKASDITEDCEYSAECEAALDNIFEFVDNLDVANDFHKIGGLNILKPCLHSCINSIRWRGAELIAELCQNNPYCQANVLNLQILPILLKMIDTDKNDTVKVKALYAVSCLVRDNEDALKELADNDGYSILLRALQSDVVKLNIKAAFLLSALCTQRPKIRDELVNMGYVEQLVGQIALQIQSGMEQHSEMTEHLLSALLRLVQDHEQSQVICRNPELQFKEIMNIVLENTEGKDNCREENEYAQSLLKIVFKEGECHIPEDR